MRRRTLISVLAGSAIAAPRVATAQTPARVFHLGTLTPGLPLGVDSPSAKVLLGVLAQRGYTVGRNLTYEARASGGQNAKLPLLLQEFKAGGIDAVVTIGFPPALAAKASGLPTVAANGVGDPVATGLIESLARPGDNVTGISDVASTLSVKRLSLLKELSPNLTKVAMLWNRDDLGMSLRYEASAAAARSLGVSVQALGVREPDDFDGVFEAMDREPPGAILMVSDSLTMLNRKRVFDYAAAKRLPAIYEYDPLVREGGLMSYGPDLKESFERAAALVDRIFKGAKPSELPFEQPTRYLFVVNLKTAKAIGLDIPPNLLARADEAIE
ncbi:MAG: ABC transporter substrate-binding protein [Reyranellales bacterium]